MARRRAPFLLVVPSAPRCCLPPCWKLAYQRRPRWKMLTVSPTGSEGCLFLSLAMRVEPFVKAQGEESVAEEAEVLAGLAAAAPEQAPGVPVVDGLLGDLQQFRGLSGGQDRRELLAPGGAEKAWASSLAVRWRLSSLPAMCVLTFS